MGEVVRTYKDLLVWQRSMSLVERVYSFTSELPSEEKYGLVAQMRRCVVSIPSNLAEGHVRATTKDFRQFVTIAYGSAAELETQLLICDRLKFGSPEDRQKTKEHLDEVLRMLNRLLQSLKQKLHP